MTEVRLDSCREGTGLVIHTLASALQNHGPGLRDKVYRTERSNTLGCLAYPSVILKHAASPEHCTWQRRHSVCFLEKAALFKHGSGCHGASQADTLVSTEAALCEMRVSFGSNSGSATASNIPPDGSQTTTAKFFLLLVTDSFGTKSHRDLGRLAVPYV